MPSPGNELSSMAMTDSLVDVSGLKPHDHAALMFQTEQERRLVITRFVTDALTSGQRCLYVVEPTRASDARLFLRTNGIDVATHERSGRLAIMPTPGCGVGMNPDDVIAFLVNEINRARDDGFSGLRVTGELASRIESIDQARALLEYEMLCNRKLYQSYPCVGMCQYDVARSAPEVINELVMIHPLVIYKSQLVNNPLYLRPEELKDHVQEARLSRLLLDKLVSDQGIDEQLELLQSALATDTHPIVFTTLDLKVVLTNRAFCDFTGYSYRELTSLRSIRDVVNLDRPITDNQTVKAPVSRSDGSMQVCEICCEQVTTTRKAYLKLSLYRHAVDRSINTQKRLLNKVLQRASSGSRPVDVIDEILNIVQEHYPGHVFGLRWKNDDEYSVVFDSGVGCQMGSHLPPQCICFQAASDGNRKPVLVQDLPLDDECKMSNVASLMVIPIWWRDECTGLLIVAGMESSSLTGADIELFEQIACIIATVLERLDREPAQGSIAGVVQVLADIQRLSVSEVDCRWLVSAAASLLMATGAYDRIYIKVDSDQGGPIFQDVRSDAITVSTRKPARCSVDIIGESGATGKMEVETYRLPWFTEQEKRLLAQVGRVVGRALMSIERKRYVLSDSCIGTCLMTTDGEIISYDESMVDILGVDRLDFPQSSLGLEVINLCRSRLTKAVQFAWELNQDVQKTSVNVRLFPLSHDQDKHILMVSGGVGQKAHAPETDELTGLYRCKYFWQEIEQHDDFASIVMVKINGLDLIGYTLGRGRADELVVLCARILSSVFKPGDIIGRLGTDEFGVVVRGSKPDELEQIKAELADKINRYNKARPTLPLIVAVGFALREDEEPVMRVIRKANATMNEDRVERMVKTTHGLGNALAVTMSAKDYAAKGHMKRVLGTATKLGVAFDLPLKEQSDLALLARVHDVGKVQLADRLLFKTGQLTKKERIQLENHAVIGYRIARSLPELTHIAEYILLHHEWWNGDGYPIGLSGEDIPLLCRILSVADAYDAMTNNRPYRSAMSHSEAVAELKRCAGRQFDPEVVDKFVQFNPDIHQ